ncbi:hypothetical protein CEXT_554191 [Caerostris extrusa]|uniref:Uncharacterized protein n=1 Tax=Caerostris extrusa TaxID=172846 RepID=A0AAV4NGK8_CAEEX|nr:hypothetical protein CEXT_554191 [Caerostris extrusa]
MERSINLRFNPVQDALSHLNYRVSISQGNAPLILPSLILDDHFNHAFFKETPTKEQTKRSEPNISSEQMHSSIMRSPLLTFWEAWKKKKKVLSFLFICFFVLCLAVTDAIKCHGVPLTIRLEVSTPTRSAPPV